MELPTVPCKTCGIPTTFTGTEQCNNCHEVEGRLDLYLRDGGDNARAFVLLRLGMPDTKEVLKRLKRWLQKERGRYDKFQREFTNEAGRERARGESNVCSLTLTKLDQIYRELKEPPG